MRSVSLTARESFDAPSTAEVELVLFVIEHASLDAPIRLSTDPSERISTDPLYYGTRSTWMGADPHSDPYLFVLVSSDVPSDLEDAPASATFILQNVDNDIATLLRSFTDQATVHMAVVLASSPNTPEIEYRDLVMTGCEGNAAEVSITISRAPIEDEGAAMDRFTKDRFPGCFR